MAGKVESDRVLSEQNRIEDNRLRIETEFQVWESTLEKNLTDAAAKGRHELVVFSGSIYNAIEKPNTLIGRHGNLFCAWRDSGPHHQARIVEAIGGLARRAYDYLKANHMEPRFNVSYNDTDELIQIIVKW
jgi:hypothetical protein